MRNREFLSLIGLILVLFAGIPFVLAQQNNKEVLRALKSGDTAFLRHWAAEDKARIYYLTQSADNASPLWNAVDNGKTTVVKFLLEMGASPDMTFKGVPALVRAAERNDLETAMQLLDAGADPDMQDQEGLTATHWAVIKRSLPLLVKLYESGASLFIQDKKGRLPSDFLKDDHPAPLKEFLNTRMQIQTKASTWPKGLDGPYVFHKKNAAEIISIHPFRDFYRIVRKNTYIKTYPAVIHHQNLAWPLIINEKYESDSTILPMPGQMFAVGDVHGNTEELLRLLQAAGVVDSALKWTFNQGYLVFLGDFTDRGNKVTEVLWLVLYLRHQAAQQGGKVLAVLGNHDMMSMLGDHRYLHPKYQHICEYFGMEYWSLYGDESESGRFLRSLPVLLKIGDNLFVHAGISWEFLQKKPQINSINTTFYQFNNTLPPRLNDLMDFMLRENGPLWYRGMIPEYDFRQQGSQQLVDSATAWFGVNRIIIGHSEMPEIRPVYGGRVIPINIPFGREGVKAQGLLWKGNDLFIIDIDGTVKPFNP